MPEHLSKVDLAAGLILVDWPAELRRPMKIEVVTLFPEMIAGALSSGSSDARWSADCWRLERRIRAPIRAMCTARSMTGPTAVVRDGVEAGADAGGDSCRAGAVARRQPADRAFGAGRALEPGAGARAGRSAGFAARSRTLRGAGRASGRAGIDREVSIGDYVLSGGELPALAVIDAVARLLPGALGDERSNVEESFVAGTAGLAALHAAGGV